MMDSEAASIRMPPEAMSGLLSSRPFPSLDRTLTIARIGSRDPASLTREDIEDLSRVTLMHYARMGVA